MQDEKTRQWFERHGLTPPSSTPHGVTPDDVRSKLRPMKAREWRLEGNRLIAKTDVGEFVNYIPSNYILTGIDENNSPVFKRI